MKKLFALFVFIGILNTVQAQYFQTGEDPASLKWRQINTENFQIIYPDYYENQAQKLAGIMEKVYLYGGVTLHHEPRKISIILHTQTVKSNGLVAWAPKRVEFFTIPHQDIYAQDWLDQLAIHEFRHVVQIDKIDSELPKIIKILLGQQGTALATGAYLPWWFIEGDAVVTETALSNSGRGRFPSFLMELQAQAVECGNNKYDKAYNGSYKSYVPDHYQLGFYMVGKSREKYGSELWNSVLERVGSKPFSLTPFEKSLKLQTGMGKVKLYNSIFDSLKNEWQAEDMKFKSVQFDIVSPKQKTYTSYQYNYWLNDTTIITYRTALNRIPAFVKMDLNGNEKTIVQPGIIFNESVNFRSEWMVWSEQVSDPRWQHSGKSIIRLRNIDTGEKRKLNTEITAMAPAISPNKKKVVVVESNFASEYFLSVYQISDGKLLNRFQAENPCYFFAPDWLSENEIVAVALLKNGKRLVKVNLEENKMETLVDVDFGEIKNLRVVKNALYFIGTTSGKNNLYRLNLQNKSVSMIYNARFGVESPAISPNNNLLLSDYTSNGFRLIRIEKENLNEKELPVSQSSVYPLANILAKQESGVIDFTELDSVKYESKKYSKIDHLFNFHSWAPVAIDVNNYEFKPGVSFMSQNKLGTAIFNVGYEWDLTQKTGAFYGKYTYKGWYPVFDFELKSGQSSSEYASIVQTIGNNGNIISQDTVLKRFTWSESNFDADMRIPFNLSRGKMNRLLQPEIVYNFTSYQHNSSTPDKFFSGNYQSLTYRFHYQDMLRKSAQDVFPNWGVTADLMYRHSPFGDVNLGHLGLIQGYLFVPGLMPNHGIRFYGGKQNKETPGNVAFSDVIRYPRGWGKINTNSMVSFASDYKFPVFYPEWNVGSLLYLQRVNASLFADFATLNANIYDNGNVTGTFDTNISSYGIELTGNANFLRFYAPVEIGTRASYLPKQKHMYFEFLFSIDFNSL